MVEGIEVFREYFTDFQDRYVLIGGTASFLALSEMGEDFRVTKDLDIVLCIEALDEQFVQRFWDFINAGGYENRQKSTGKKLFYRFYSPGDVRYPEMLELFSRVPDALSIGKDSRLTPIPLGDEVSSLSAILLNENYYNLIHQRKRIVGGLSIVGAECLILLKAVAYVDLRKRKEAGQRVDMKDIKKHKNDIFRLYRILDPTLNISLHQTIQIDLENAFKLLRSDPIDLKTLGISGTTVDGILQEMRRVYGILG